MTEAEWGACDDPIVLLHALRGLATERKLRLWACACCRRPWGRPRRAWGHRRLSAARRVVEATERHADGLLCGEALDALRADLLRDHGHRQARASLPALAAFHASGDGAAGYLRPCLLAVKHASDCAADLGQEARAQAALLRDVFAWPGRPLPAVGATLAWGEGLVPRLAEAAYCVRALPTGELSREALAVLSDAVEEAGGPPALASHLRSPGPHVAGCWAIDALTWRE
jgi:hypothetical protein